MNALSIALLVSLIILCGTICFGLYVWWKKSVYTREKFAFAGASAFIVFSMFVLSSVYAQQPPWLALIGLIKQMSGLPYEVPQALTWEQEFISVLLVFAFLYLIIYLHKHWDGAKSIQQYEREQNQLPSGLWSESYLVLQSLKNPKLLELYKPEAKFSTSALRGADDSLAWHVQAKELLELTSDSYEFLEDQWHDQQKCWLGKQKHNQNTVLLACLDDRPDDDWQSQLLAYGKKFWDEREKGDLEIIVALKNGVFDEIQKPERCSIRIVSESKLLDGLVDFSNYFRELRKQVEEKKLDESDLTIADIYTVSDYKLEKDAFPSSNLEDFLNQWLADSSLRQLALLGEYGQGKSTASLMFSYGLIKRLQQNDKSVRIPILIELRGKSPRNLTPNELFANFTDLYRLKPRALLKLAQAGRLLVIFEGFDEVDLCGNADIRIEHFLSLWRLCYPKAKILITGRPNYFLDEPELKCALGIREHSLEQSYCQAVYLAPFNPDQIKHSLRNQDERVREGIMRLALVNPRFYEIVSRPSMLHLVSVLWLKNKLGEREQINSVDVMDLYVDYIYQRQSAKEKSSSFMSLYMHERAFFMQGIAVYMLVGGLQNQITTQQLDEVVRLLIDIIPDSVSLCALVDCWSPI